MIIYKYCTKFRFIEAAAALAFILVFIVTIDQARAQCDPLERIVEGAATLDIKPFEGRCFLSSLRCNISNNRADGSFTMRSMPGTTNGWIVRLTSKRSVSKDAGFRLRTNRNSIRVRGEDIRAIDRKNGIFEIKADSNILSLIRSGTRLDWEFSRGTRKQKIRFSLVNSRRMLDWAICLQKSKPACIAPAHLNEWLSRFSDAKKSLVSLQGLADGIGDFALDAFGHKGISKSEKEELREEAKEAVAGLHSLYRERLESIALRTTRACDICRFKPTFVAAKKAGFGDKVTEKQLERLNTSSNQRTLRRLARAKGELEDAEEVKREAQRIEDVRERDRAIEDANEQIRDAKREIRTETAKLKESLGRIGGGTPFKEKFDSVNCAQF